MTLVPDLLPADDRGLAYGDGCFETLRLVDGRAPLAAWHLERMAAGARRLGIPLDRERWWRRLEQLAGQGDSGEGVAKLILTRGSGGRGYLPPARPAPRLLGQWHPRPAPPAELTAQGLVLGLASQRLATQPELAGIKHLNRLPQVLARSEAARQGWHEALMLDEAGRPLELTSMNLFLVRRGELRTPSLARAGVAGVMRALLLRELAPSLGLTVRVGGFHLEAMRQAEEIFVCNSVVGVLPVRKLGLWQWRPGEVTRALREAVETRFRS